MNVACYVLHVAGNLGSTIHVGGGSMGSRPSGLDEGPRNPDRESLLAALNVIVGSAHVLIDSDVMESYSRDWTGRWSGEPIAVVRPGTTEQVAAVVKVCADHGVAIVPQGGNTGLVGAGVPSDGEVVLSTRRLRELNAVDVRARTVEVGAGVTLAEIQGHVRAAGLDVGIDFGARDSATIGGIVATNASSESCGTARHVSRYWGSRQCWATGHLSTVWLDCPRITSVSIWCSCSSVVKEPSEW